MDPMTLDPFQSPLVLGSKDAFLILTIGWHQPIRLGNSQRLWWLSVPAGDLETVGGVGSKQEWGGRRSSLESPGV